MILKLKSKFDHYKNQIFKKDLDIENILIPSKVSYGEKNCKYCIGWLHGWWLWWMMDDGAYEKKYFGGTKWM